MDTTTTQRPRRIVWENVLTVVSAAILISAEVFGAAFAGSWAIANLFALGTIGARMLDGLFVLCGIVVMVQFVRAAKPRRAVRRRLNCRLCAAVRERRLSGQPFVKTKTLAHARRNGLLAKSPNFARACGRVSVGGHPDKRPDSRLRKTTSTSLLPRPAAGGETGIARSPRATRLKATTEGLFWIDCRRQCRGHRKGLSFFASSAERDLPHPDQGSNHGDATRSAIAELHVSQEVHLGGYAASRIRGVGW